MKNPGVSGKNAALIIAVLCICLTLITLVGFLSSDSTNNLMNDLRDYIGLKLRSQSQDEVFTPAPNSFTIPAIPGYFPKKYETTPTRRTRLQPGFYLSSNYKTSEFFRDGISYFQISIKNEGRNSIFICRYGVSVNASENRIYSENCGALLSPGEEKILGVIAVKVPSEEKASFKIILWLLACTSKGEWHEYEPYYMSGFEANLEPMPEKVNSVYQYDPSYYTKILNQLVEPAEPSIKNTSAEIARSYPGAYNIYQICAIFDNVQEQIKYVNDPRGHDFWSAANATLEIGAGDCDDKAILISSMLEAVGGTTRIYLIDTHAFTAVYIGSGTKATEAAVKGVRAYYGNVDVYYLTDEYGSWLMLDPTSSFYAGGLPGTTAPVNIQADGKKEAYRTWTFVNTSEVKVIDISPESD